MSISNDSLVKLWDENVKIHRKLGELEEHITQLETSLLRQNEINKQLSDALVSSAHAHLKTSDNISHITKNTTALADCDTAIINLIDSRVKRIYLWLVAISAVLAIVSVSTAIAVW